MMRSAGTPRPPAAAADEVLAARLIEGDPGALDQLVRRWRDRVVDLAHLLTGDRDAAEDVGQEVFLRLFRRPAAYDPRRPFGAWIAVVTRNLCRDRYRREEARRRHHRLAVLRGRSRPGAPPAPSEAAAAGELEERLREAIAALPPPFREAYVLCAVRGFSYEEAGKICGCNPKTISTRLARARRRLLARMKRWL